MIGKLTIPVLVLLLGACEQREGVDPNQGFNQGQEPMQPGQQPMEPGVEGEASTAQRQALEQRLTAIDQWVEARRSELATTTDQASQDAIHWLDQLDARITGAEQELSQPDANVSQIESTVNEIERDIQSGYAPQGQPMDEQEQQPLEPEMEG